MPTSLISRIKRDSLIVFQSSNEDIELFGNSDKKFSFSHFALLNLPDIRQSSSNANVMDFERVQSRFLSGNSTATPPSVGDAIDLSESFQNYVLNMESIMMTSEDYDKSLLKNSNERIFWKWLKEIGAIRWRNASQTESNFNDRFCEEDDNNTLTGDLYNRVVQYIGDISIQNKVTNNKNTFEEVFIHVPSFAGNTPNPIFKTVADTNYSVEKAFLKEDQNSAEIIDGFDQSDSPINELNLFAQYDIDVDTLTYTSVNDDNPLDNSVWHDYYTGDKAYLTDKSFADPTNDTITVTDGVGTKTYKRSRLDGVTLDLDKSSYVGLNSATNQAFSELASVGSGYFFNAVAIYYQVERNGEIETNLFGILFVDDVKEVSGGQSTIGRLEKIKGSSLLSQSGNAFGFKLNFRVDSADGNIVVDVSSDVDSYNVFSMHLFSETMGKMNKFLVDHQELILKNITLQNTVQNLLNVIQQNNAPLSSTQLASIQQQLLTDTQYQVVASQLSSLYQTLQQILQGSTSVDVNVLLSPIGYNGIKTELLGNILKIQLDSNDYSSFEQKQVDTQYGNSNEFLIGARKKLCVMTSVSNVVAQDDINVYLDDTVDNWQNLQSVVLTINPNIDLDGKSVNVYTDKGAVLSNQSYGVLVGSIKPASNRVEVVCLDKVNLTFAITS